MRRSWFATHLACLALCAAATPIGAHAQAPPTAFGEYRLDVWQPGLGLTSTLPANNINFLAQSADGYLWLATSAGLSRFDGVRFELFTSATTPAFRNRLAYLLWPMDLPHRDTMLVTTDRGMVAYAGGNFIESPPDTTLEGEAVQQLAALPNGEIYGITVRGTLFRLDRGRYVRIPLPGVPASDGFGIVADTGGTLWIAHDRAGLVRYRNGVGTRLGSTDGLDADRVTCVVRASDGALWVGTSTGVARMASGHFTTIDFWGGQALHPVFAGTETADGAMWFATDGGGVVHVRPRGDGSFATSSFTHRDGLTDDRAISILTDREGDIWVGTRLGLNRFHPVPFEAITTRDGLPAAAMGAILLDTIGRLWIAPVAGGLYRGRVVDGRAMLTMVAPPSDGRATTLAKGRDGGVWVGWQKGGATGYSPSGAKTFIGAESGIAPGTVFAIRDPPGGALWIGARDGLSRLTRDSHGVLRTRNFTARDGLQENLAMRLWTRKPTDMWVGNAALSHIIGDSVRTFRVADGLAAPIVTAIRAEASGALWVGTHGGLSRMLGGKLVALHSAQGLMDEYVNAIEQDVDENLWLAGAQGLTRIALSDLDSTADALEAGRPRVLTSAVTFGTADGLPGQDAVLDASPGSFHSPDGKLWFAMAWGIAVVDPTRVPRDTLRPLPHIQSVIADGQPVKLANDMELAAGTRRVEVRYTGVSLSDGAGVRLRYRLDGLDTNWVDAGAQRIAAFTHLPPGDFMLHVQARSARGAWGPAESTLRFRLLPAFYQQWWFIALCIALAAAAILVAIELRRRQLESRMSAVIDERTRMARELHDTLLQGFTGIALQLRALGARRKQTHADDSSQALDALVGLAESTLSEARHAVWDMRAPVRNPGAPVGSALVDQLERAARETVGSASIALDFAVAGDRTPLDANTEEELSRIGREAIANAVRHGEPRRIVVSLVYEPAALRLMVRDDGRGFDANGPPEVQRSEGGRGHFGLIGMRERAVRIGARLTITSEPGRGTTVVIVLQRRP